MGLVNKLYNFIGIEDDEEMEKTKIYDKKQLVVDDDLQNIIKDRKKQNKKTAEVINLNNNIVNTAQKMLIYEPTNYEKDSKEIMQSLRNGHPVVVNYEKMNDEEYARLFFYLWGTIDTISGTIQMVGHKIYLYAPKHIEVSLWKENENKTRQGWKL